MKHLIPSSFKKIGGRINGDNDDKNNVIFNIILIFGFSIVLACYLCYKYKKKKI